MVNRPRNKGTMAESAVVGYLQENGFPYAERRALKGAADWGDVAGCIGLVVEIKYTSGTVRLGEWMAETQLETANARADHGLLVIKPRGAGATKVSWWYAVLLDGAFNALWSQAQLQVPLADAKPEAFNNTKLPSDFSTLQASSDGPFEFATLLRRPPGAKDKPEEWYRIMSLRDAIRLLRAAGYGSPLEME